MKVKYFGKTEIVMAVLSALLLFVSAMIAREFVKDSIKTHDSGWMSVRGNSYININYIDPEPLATNVDGTNLYLAGYLVSDDLTDYFVLQADPDSEDTKTLLANADNLDTQPQRVLGSRNGSQTNEKIVEIVQQTSQSTDLPSEISLYFEGEDYFSISDLENPVLAFVQAAFWTLVAYGIFAAFPNVYVIVSWRKARRAAKTFFATYPELAGDLSNIESGAAYLDKQTGLAIYKNHLISFNQQFAAADLQRVTDLQISGRANQAVFGPIGLVFIMMILQATMIRVKGDSRKDRQVMIAHKSLDTLEAKDKFVAAIASYSPSITVK